MTGSKTMYSMRLGKELIERLDLYRAGLPYRVGRTAVIEKAIADHLDREGAPPLANNDQGDATRVAPETWSPLEKKPKKKSGRT